MAVNENKCKAKWGADGIDGQLLVLIAPPPSGVFDGKDRSGSSTAAAARQPRNEANFVTFTILCAV